MSDEIANDDVVDEDESEVEGFAMFDGKPGLADRLERPDLRVGPDLTHPTDGMGLPDNTNEPVLSDDEADDEDAEVEGHVLFAEKKGFALKPDLYAPPSEPQLDDWERSWYGPNTNEPVLDDVA